MIKTCMIGFFFGLIVPILGMIIGLFYSYDLAQILLFPIIYIASYLNDPYGAYQKEYAIILYLVSGILYSLAFGVVRLIVNKIINRHVANNQ